jgi:preprotein translocase subunit YajC
MHSFLPREGGTPNQSSWLGQESGMVEPYSRAHISNLPPKRLPFSFNCLKCPTAFEFMRLIDLHGMLAQAGAPQTGQPQPGGLFGSPLVLLVLMGVMMYFLLFRPQQQQRAKHAELLKNLKSGDKIVTASGIIGVVITVKDQTVSLRSADAKMEVTKASVTEIIEGGNAAES